jgi:hypothetical protein
MSGAPAGGEGGARRRLSSAAWGVVDAMAEALLADVDDAGRLVGPPADERARLVAEFDDWMLHGGAVVPVASGWVLRLLDLLPLLIVGRLSTLRGLPLGARINYLEAVERSPVGLLATALISVKIPLVMLAYETGERLATTGFDRGSLGERRRLQLIEPGPIEPTLVRGVGP